MQTNYIVQIISTHTYGQVLSVIDVSTYFVHRCRQCLVPALQAEAARHQMPLLLWFVVPQVEKDVWLFEQTQAIEAFDVYTPVRMTVIKLKSGGLWVHGPVAPTQVGPDILDFTSLTPTRPVLTDTPVEAAG